MARIRTIKPEFWTSEQVVTCSPLARLLFVGLWSFCDDGGVHPASIRRLKMEVFPADTFDDSAIAGWLAELVNAGLVHEYEANGERFWFVTGWHRHQRIDKPTFRHPPPPNVAGITSPIRRMLGEDSSNARRVVADASPPDRNGLESNGIGKELERTLSSADADSAKGAKSSNPKKPSATKFSDDDLTLAREMFAEIQKLSPDAKPPNFEKWANTIRLLRSDGSDRTPAQIRATLTWVRHDQFWTGNILSPEKLRQHWDQLQFKMRESRNGQRTTSTGTSRNGDGLYRETAKPGRRAF